MTESSNESTDSTRETGLSASERHCLLAAERRRLALEILAGETSPVDLDDLAAAIAMQENGNGTADATTVERVAITLHHYHLPPLVAAGVLDYDPETQRIDPDGGIVDADHLL